MKIHLKATERYPPHHSTQVNAPALTQLALTRFT